MFDYLGTAPEEAGVAVLAANSRGNTWDAIRGRAHSEITREAGASIKPGA